MLPANELAPPEENKGEERKEGDDGREHTAVLHCCSHDPPLPDVAVKNREEGEARTCCWKQDTSSCSASLTYCSLHGDRQGRRRGACSHRRCSRWKIGEEECCSASSISTKFSHRRSFMMLAGAPPKLLPLLCPSSSKQRGGGKKCCCWTRHCCRWSPHAARWTATPR